MVKNCDEYFYLGHRAEPRGAGGIFFDHINSNDWERDFDFIKQVGKSTHQVVTQIVESKKDLSWTEEEKNLQTTLLLDPDNEEAMYMLIKIELKRSNYSQVKKLRDDFSIICSTLCDKIKSINETLKNIEPKNAS